jgi:hypothetical protein
MTINNETFAPEGASRPVSLLGTADAPKPSSIDPALIVVSSQAPDLTKPQDQDLCEEQVQCTERTDVKFWAAFGADLMPLHAEPAELTNDPIQYFDANPDQGIACRLPERCFVVAATEPDAAASAASVCQLIAAGPPFRFIVQGRTCFLYRMAEGQEVPEPLYRPADVQLFRPGAVIELPSGDDFQPETYLFKSLNGLPLVTAADLHQLTTPRPGPEIKDTPFSAFSMLGKSAEYEAKAIVAKPLLGDLCLSGQATIWYAPPNAGKTLVSLKLLADAVNEGRVNPANAFYINADDSSQGLAEKMALMDELGVHTLAPGHQEFRPENLTDLLREAAKRDKARSCLVIIDTVKKFTSLMDKGKASAFADACRTYVMAGGTIVGFAHTNKKPSVDGSLVYAGTSDLIDDFDAAYVLTPIRAEADGETIVSFQNLKRRGNNPEAVAFAYSRDTDITYAERLASVREVETSEVEGFRRREAEHDAADLIAKVRANISQGTVGKMALAKRTAAQAGVSERSVIRLLEQYSGDDPTQHHWRFTRGSRGAQLFELLQREATPPPEAAT